MKDYDIIIIGGGITGAGTARDCAMRGLKTLLVERNDIATGATGRNHGLLHSGARYAVKDPESAAECIKENIILRRIASHCVETSGGLFITLPEDEQCGYGLDYQEVFIEACNRVGIDADRIRPEHARREEPAVNQRIIGAVRVPDGSVDPFRLCSDNILDARIHGADILLYTNLDALIIEDNTIKGVKVTDRSSGTRTEYRSKIVINAGGIWSQAIAAMAGITINMYPAKGSLLIFNHRVNSKVINRCRKSADGDILVPGDSVCVLGTTSTRVSFEECDNLRVSSDEVELLLREGSVLCPSLETTRIIRAYCGVRPLVASDNDPTGRNISRGIVCLDHETRDGVKGFITITGGKLMTYRLMAQMATDLACRKLDVKSKCETAVTPLPGSRGGKKNFWIEPTLGQKAALFRHGANSEVIDFSSDNDKKLICECENVTYGEIKYAVKNLHVTTLEDLRRRTRVGMGTCQGTYCIHKAAAALADALEDKSKAPEIARAYLCERWKGMKPVAWGDTLREMEFMQKVYKEGLPYTYEI